MELVPCGQTFQGEDNSKREKLGPAQRKRLHIPHSQGQGHLPNHTCTESLFRGKREGEGHHPITGDVNVPIGLFTRIHFGKEM